MNPETPEEIDSKYHREMSACNRMLGTLSLAVQGRCFCLGQSQPLGPSLQELTVRKLQFNVCASIVDAQSRQPLPHRLLAMPGNQTMKVSHCCQNHCKRAETRRDYETHCRRRARRGVQSLDPACHITKFVSIRGNGDNH